MNSPWSSEHKELKIRTVDRHEYVLLTLDVEVLGVLLGPVLVYPTSRDHACRRRFDGLFVLANVVGFCFHRRVLLVL